jgi:DNA-binding transcriptional LysR family regulator
VAGLLHHPGIEIEIAASNTARDLRRREADIAVRNFTPTQPDLVAKKIADRDARLYATPAYLKRLGNPSQEDAMNRPQCQRLAERCPRGRVSRQHPGFGHRRVWRDPERFGAAAPSSIA